jgi:hypothetical protein
MNKEEAETLASKMTGFNPTKKRVKTVIEPEIFGNVSDRYRQIIERMGLGQ